MWKTLIVDPVSGMWAQARLFLSGLSLVILILVIGWIIAKIIRNLATKVLKVLDKYAEQGGIDDVLAKGGIKYSLSELVGTIIYWLVILITVSVAFNAVDLTFAGDLLNQIILYIPNVIAAIIVLVLGGFAAKILSNIVLATTANVGLDQSKLLAKISEIVVIAFVVVVALQQLRIGQFVIGPATLIILASVGLGLALAFGLGGRDVAREALENWLKKMKSKK